MYTFKKKLITHACALSFLAASVGSGFGAWIFTNHTSSKEQTPDVIETDALVYSNKISCEFVSKSLILDDTDSSSNPTFSGFSIQAKAQFQHIGNTNTSDFSVLYTVACSITDNSGASKLEDYICLSSVAEITTTKETATTADKDDTSDTTRYTSDYNSSTKLVNMKHKFTYVSGTTDYSMNVLIFPYFTYKKRMTSVDDFAVVKTAVSNATFNFTITLTDVTLEA